MVKIDENGGGQEIYTAPGIMLMALPLPWDDNYWMISSEGWPAPDEGKPADPRWQSVYIVDINNPEEYREVEYPISRYPSAPKEGLYGAAAALSSDSRTLFNTGDFQPRRYFGFDAYSCAFGTVVGEARGDVVIRP